MVPYSIITKICRILKRNGQAPCLIRMSQPALVAGGGINIKPKQDSNPLSESLDGETRGHRIDIHAQISIIYRKKKRKSKYRWKQSTGIKTRISMWRRQQCKTGCKTYACCRNASANVQMLLLLTFAPARFAARPIHSTVGFSNNVKGCYVQPPQQVWPRFCARFEVAQLPHSWITIVQLLRPHACRLVHERSPR